MIFVFMPMDNGMSPNNVVNLFGMWPFEKTREEQIFLDYLQVYMSKALPTSVKEDLEVSILLDYILN